jgi:beta-glucanase (GH16 family)
MVTRNWLVLPGLAVSALGLLLIPVCVEAAPPPTAGVDWQLDPTFSDEFNVDGLDTNKWDRTYPQWSGRTPGEFIHNTVQVNGGFAKLDVWKAFPGVLPEGKEYAVASLNTSASRRTRGYGYYEIRAQAMDATTTSSFWLHHNTSERWTEIDIFELVTTKPREMPINTHVFRENGVMLPESDPRVADPHDASFDTAQVAAGQTHDNSFHTYGLNWTADTLEFYLDDALVYSVANHDFHEPMWMSITNTIHPWIGIPTAQELDASAHPFTVDYVRVYDAVPVPEPTALGMVGLLGATLGLRRRGTRVG